MLLARSIESETEIADFHQEYHWKASILRLIFNEISMTFKFQI